VQRRLVERLGLVPIVLWLALGACLAAVTGRVADWFVMTDELLYERLALSVDRLHSPLPHVHEFAARVRLRQLEADGVVRVACAKALAFFERDDVVGRAQHATQVGNARGVIAKSAESAEVGHGS